MDYVDLIRGRPSPQNDHHINAVSPVTVLYACSEHVRSSGFWIRASLGFRV